MSKEDVGARLTKGPWSFRYYMDPVGKNDDNFHLFEGPEGDEGPTILEGAFVFPGTHSDALKIARLIAAAPALFKALQEARNVLMNSDAESGCCMCGDPVASHNMGSGHAPVDSHIYMVGQTVEKIDAALSQASSGDKGRVEG